MTRWMAAAALAVLALAGAAQAQEIKVGGLFASMRAGVFGLVIVLFLIFEPDGMAARWRTVRDYWKLYPFSY